MKLRIAFLMLLIPLCLQAQLKINELMSNNVSAVMDDGYNYSMWVEFYNAGDSTADQQNYYMTNDISDPMKFQLPVKKIASGGYNVVWSERDELSGHANFKLDPEGGSLYLFDASQQMIDSVIYPVQYRNVSYGRISDGAAQWTYFPEYSWRCSNNNRISGTQQCSKPNFTVPCGFYATSQNVRFNLPASGDTIYYSTDSSEPTRQSQRYIPGNYISVTTTTCVRARTFSGTKIPSNVVSATYFIGSRKFTLPVVSIITETKNLTDNTIGIYVQGTNGIIGNGYDSPCNWNQDWDRPANVELFDTTGVVRINQEMDISVAGGWSRAWNPKSLNLSPRKKFGNNKIDYDVFAATKPGHQYKDIRLRNSGNDYNGSHMRDAFMQSLIMHRTNIDYLAYEPAVCFINGVYYGIENLRERSNKDYLYSNYGLDEGEFEMYEKTDIYNSPFVNLMNYVNANDVANDAVYATLCDSIDMDNFMDYMLSEIYFKNTDWPHNNVRIWRRNSDKKWRFIMFDTDFGFESASSNTLTYALTSTDKFMDYCNTHISVVFRNLVKNQNFLNHFIDRFCIHISSTFESTRVNQVMDSLSAKIQDEVVWHQAKWGGNYSGIISTMKSFATQRPNYMLGFISSQYLNNAATQTINISSNINTATYTFNGEDIIDNEIALKSFNNRNVAIQANNVNGYTFKHWIVVGDDVPLDTLMTTGNTWSYYDNGMLPADNWNTAAYNDATWNTGVGQLGYGDRFASTLQTTLSYGSNTADRYVTAYFRKKVQIQELADKENFQIHMYVDDGAVVYINGTEIGRYNMPTGDVAYGTFSTTYNNGDNVTLDVPTNVLQEGENLIAVEVHQCDNKSSDLVFDLSLTCNAVNNAENIYTNAVYTTTLIKNIQLQAIYEEAETSEPENIPAVFLNELVASNTLFADEYAEMDDYIELYNAGDTAVNVGGWYLTDTPDLPMLCQIPTSNSQLTTIAPQSWLVLWADKQPEQGILHLNMKLGKTGETIILSLADAKGRITQVDSVVFPTLGDNQSYSRVPDGSSTWIIQNSTYNATNDYLSKVEVPTTTAVQVYPVAVQSFVNVCNAQGKTLRIFDLMGNLVLQQHCSTCIERISMDKMQTGMYLLYVDDHVYKILKTAM